MNLEFDLFDFFISHWGRWGEEKRILQSELEKVIKAIRDKKATGDDVLYCIFI